MKKERKLKLEVNKVSVSNLYNISGGGGSDLVASINFLCVLTTVPHSIPGHNCKTFVTVGNGSDRC